MASKLRHAYELVVWSGPAPDAADGSLVALAREAEAILTALTTAGAGGRAARATGAAIRRLPAEPLGAVVVGAD
jgi:hypothetical protein